MNQLSVVVELLRKVISAAPTDEEGLLWMVLFHNFDLYLNPGVLDDVPANLSDVYRIAPQTRFGVAEALAAAWPSRIDGARCNPYYWHDRYCKEVPFETFEQLPPDKRDMIEALRIKLKNERQVEDVLPAAEDLDTERPDDSVRNLIARTPTTACAQPTGEGKGRKASVLAVKSACRSLGATLEPTYRDVHGGYEYYVRRGNDQVIIIVYPGSRIELSETRSRLAEELRGRLAS